MKFAICGQIETDDWKPLDKKLGIYKVRPLKKQRYFIINKKIKSNNVFIGAILSQTIVLIIYFNQGDSIGYLWFNFIGTLLTCSISYFLYILNENINNSTK